MYQACEAWLLLLARCTASPNSTACSFKLGLAAFRGIEMVNTYTALIYVITVQKYSRQSGEEIHILPSWNTLIIWIIMKLYLVEVTSFYTGSRFSFASTATLPCLAFSFFTMAQITRSMNSQRVSRLAPKHRPIVPPTFATTPKEITQLDDSICTQSTPERTFKVEFDNDAHSNDCIELAQNAA
mgnify:CR=1 FL=1